MPPFGLGSGEGVGNDGWNAINGEERKRKMAEGEEAERRGSISPFYEKTVWCTAVSILTLSVATGAIPLIV